jgi:hypothetical protein
MKKLSNIIMMTMAMTVLFSSCSKTNELDPCYVIEQEIERQEALIDRMMVLYLSPTTDPDIWGQLNVRMMEARAKLSELEIERSEICG